MAPRDPSFCKNASADQVVRAPSRADGIGHALRRTFDPAADLPAEWQEFLRRLSVVSRH